MKKPKYSPFALPTLSTEKVYLLDALGRVLAEDVISEEDRPSFDNSAMDGYAVHWEDIKDAPVELLVVGRYPRVQRRILNYQGVVQLRFLRGHQFQRVPLRWCQ